VSVKPEARLKLAVQVIFPLTVTVPVLQPVPDHPANVEPLAVVAVSTTDVPLAKGCEQSVPQLIPVPVTVPLPVPLLFTVRVKVMALKVAVTVVAALIDTVQVPVPVHPPPLHPANVEPEAAAAVSTTDAPLL
jgi:hypothetical protein